MKTKRENKSLPLNSYLGKLINNTYSTSAPSATEQNDIYMWASRISF